MFLLYFRGCSIVGLLVGDEGGFSDIIGRDEKKSRNN